MSAKLIKNLKRKWSKIILNRKNNQLSQEERMFVNNIYLSNLNVFDQGYQSPIFLQTKDIWAEYFRR